MSTEAPGRAAFEVWARTSYFDLDLDEPGSGYCATETDAAWLAWQASRAAALTDAAAAVMQSQRDSSERFVIDNALDAIRALALKEPAK